MLLFTGILLGLIVGTIRKGSIFRLNSLKWLWIVFVPFIVSLLIKYYPEIPLLFKAGVTTVSYLCVLIFVFANRKYLVPSIILGLGTLSNYLVIAVNGFRMPISVKALSIYPSMTAEAVLSQRADYFVATDGARLLFLGDVIYFPVKIFEGFLSIGDVFLALGMFILIVQVMGKNCFVEKKPPETSSDREI